MPKKGFTWVEILAVVSIMGILAAIAMTQYFTYVEKGRSVEARNLLGQIRQAEERYSVEFDAYTANLSLLKDVVAPASCNKGHYFWYEINNSGGNWRYLAHRCTANGRPPNNALGYILQLAQDGTLSQPASYF